MPFSKKLLYEGEEIVLDLRPHWWFFAKQLVLAVVLAVATVFVLVQDINEWLLVALAALTAVAAVWLAGRLIRWSSINFVVTTDRLVYRSGVLAKKGKEIPLERINDISFNQRAFERLMGSGDLMIESGGTQGQQHFYDIRRPAAVQNQIHRSIEAAQARDADRMSGRRDLSLPEQLEKLDELRRRGVISQAEFDAKKVQLLERM
ncbi:MAG: FIG00995613: hypothetical protein [uncultured Acidimicrobiales bacterium]|uniref:DUF304 domain-containing protein n=1 Tax=uncultured Acidimicrobiales bacterium TaxID=310071 RepID=A0A6J4HN08_9ACTN|nr:MAG: FIG00995613: hypothetical protein [uncultured Acidimicrobiales bacterium]